MPKKINKETHSILAFINSPQDIIGRNINSLTVANDKIDEQIAKLQGELTRERDSRKEERFIWVLVLMLLLDVAFVLKFGAWCTLLIMLFQVTILLIMAHMWGIECAIKLLRLLLNKLINSMGNQNKK